MVEVFKTNVIQNELAFQLRAALESRLPSHKINFDLEDCDKILRIEGHTIPTKMVIEFLANQGFQCEVLN